MALTINIKRIQKEALDMRKNPHELYYAQPLEVINHFFLFIN